VDGKWTLRFTDPLRCQKRQAASMQAAPAQNDDVCIEASEAPHGCSHPHSLGVRELS
jgi:hypothetical protein